MKKALIIVLMVALLVLFALNASALIVNSATLGGPSQDRVNDVSTTFRVKNNGTTNITGMTVTTDADTKYNIRFNPSTFNLTAGAEKIITVTGDIPYDHPAVVDDENAADWLKEKPKDIGDIIVNDGTSTHTANLEMQAENQLKISSATLHCGDKSDKLSKNDKVDDLKPDTENCYMEVEVENLFRSTSDIILEDVQIEIEVDHDDFNVDASTSISSIDPGEEEYADESDLDFDIDEDVKDRTYTMEIRAWGYDYDEDEDRTGALHGMIWEIKLDVVRENYDIQIRSPRMTPAKMDCKGGTLKVDANIINLGKKDDDEVAAEVDIPDLTLNTKRSGIDLDESDSTGVSFTIKIPENVTEGVYPVTLNTYFKSTALSDTETFELVIEKCETPEPEEPVDTTPNDVVVVTPTEPTTPTGAVPAAPRARVKTTDDSEFRQSSGYLWLMGLLVVLLAAIVVVLLIVFFVRKPAGKK